MTPVALVTGGNRGLGAELARFLARDGYDLVLTARGRGPLELTASELRGFGGEARTFAGAVSDPSHRRRLARSLEGTGRLDLLVNNASALGERILK